MTVMLVRESSLTIRTNCNLIVIRLLKDETNEKKTKNRLNRCYTFHIGLVVEP